MQNLEWYLADLKSTGKNTVETVEKSLTDVFIRLVRIYSCLVRIELRYIRPNQLYVIFHYNHKMRWGMADSAVKIIIPEWPFFGLFRGPNSTSCTDGTAWYVFIFSGPSSYDAHRDEWGARSEWKNPRIIPKHTHYFTFSLRISHLWRFGTGETYLPTCIRTAAVPLP